MKLTEHGRIHKIFHVTDIENLLGIDNLESSKLIMPLFNLINKSKNITSNKYNFLINK